MACQVCGSNQLRTTTSGYTQCTNCGYKEGAHPDPEIYRREYLCPNLEQHSWRETTSGYRQCVKCGYKTL